MVDRGTSLWINLDAEENWLGLGLCFCTDKANGLFQHAGSAKTSLAAELGCRVYVEDQGQRKYLASYRFARLSDRQCWDELYAWMSERLAKYSKVYAGLKVTPVVTASVAN